MNRLIIESVEGRIMLGITMFVAIMILVGWVAINEPARMAEFVEQHEGRSIERGAELFAANCSTCHGVDGYGIAGRAPGLNNPHFFGYNYVAEINAEIAGLQRGLLDIYGVTGLQGQGIADQVGTLELTERNRDDLLTAIADAGDVSEEEQRALIVEFGHVDARLSDDLEQVAARIEAIEAGEPIGDDADPMLEEEELEARLNALQSNIPTIIAENTALLGGTGEEPGLLEQRDALLAELDGAILRGYYPRLEEVRAQVEELENDSEQGNEYPLFLTTYIDTGSDRLSQIEFGGSLQSYITTTLIHGRPGSNIVWDAPMVSWAQTGGGPLRDDQIADITAFIQNWNKGDDWSLADFEAVQQYARIYSQYSAGGGGDMVESFGTDASAEAVAALPEGDATRGEDLYTGNAATSTGAVLGCSGCHLNGAAGPDTVGTWTRTQNQRLTQPEFEGYTGEQYLAESIVAPNAYVAPGWSGLMPANFGEQVTDQDLADLIAYLRNQNQ